MVKRIAIIGSGVSGLISAHLLSRVYEVSIFEANNYLGGHIHTNRIHHENSIYNIDSGFIVFNKKTYPNFTKLLEKLHVPIQTSEMSFSYRSDVKKIEYNGHSLNTLFATRRNLLNRNYYHLIKEIIRFNKDAKSFLKLDEHHLRISMREYIRKYSYSEILVDCYLIPMMASIWSKRKDDIMASSAYFILHFYLNHGLLDNKNRPQWYVISDGSHTYIPKLITNFRDNIYLSTKIEHIVRENGHVILKTKTDQFVFDAVVIATHSDQALKMLANPTEDEGKILSLIKYIDNDVILHTDDKLMPKHKRAWASWNYYDSGNSLPSLTYYMNRLQSIKTPPNFFVSLNLNELIDEEKIIKKLYYSHPCFNQNAINAQKQFDRINGKNNTYYAGAYWGYGFHEDGVKSGIVVANSLGIDYEP